MVEEKFMLLDEVVCDGGEATALMAWPFPEVGCAAIDVYASFYEHERITKYGGLDMDYVVEDGCKNLLARLELEITCLLSYWPF
ncbi:hypothetical protein RJT34_25493 [Clitoria ternatea]|uniref:Uncharacterized protein n=1 Tax=Clitoria ternatea TaxID=43366 RepID=A0AAN9FS34_CLITE